MLYLRLIWRDLWLNWRPTLSLLLILSITIIISGLLWHLRLGLNQRVVETYEAGQPPDLILHTSEFADPNLLKQLIDLPEILVAEPVREVRHLRLQYGDEIWRPLILNVRPTNKPATIHRILPENEHKLMQEGIVIERSGLNLSEMGPGDVVNVDTWDEQLEVAITGQVYSPSEMSSQLSQRLMGYTSLQVLETLTGISTYNQIYVRLTESTQEGNQLQGIRQALHNEGISLIDIENSDQSHPLSPYLEPTNLLFQSFGWLAVGLSILLINTVARSFITNRLAEIGRLKGLGFPQRTIWLVYIGGFLFVGGVAIILAVPISTLIGELFLERLSSELNLDFGGDQWPLQVWVGQLLIGLAVPLIAAGQPIYRAIRQSTVTLLQEGRNRVITFGILGSERWLNRLEWLHPIVLYAFRNLFRHKSRLLFMVLPITLAGAISVTILNLRLSIEHEVTRTSSYWLEDIRLELPKPVGAAVIRNELLAIDRVSGVEARLIVQSRRLRPSGNVDNQDDLAIVALPTDTPYLKPTLLSGRWLQPSDTAHIVINSDYLRTEPGLKAGDQLDLDIRNVGMMRFEVVGIVTGQLIGATGEFREPVAYVQDRYLQEKVAKLGQATHFIIQTDSSDPIVVRQVAKELEDSLKRYQITPDQLDLIRDLRFAINNIFQTTIRIVLALLVLFGFVGLLSLSGLIRINLFERSAELKTLHSIGFHRSQIFAICYIETLMIITLSLCFSALIALGLTKWANLFLGKAFINHSLDQVFNLWHLVIWGVITCIISIILTYRFAVQIDSNRNLF